MVVDQLWVQSDRRRSDATIGGQRNDMARVPCVANIIMRKYMAWSVQVVIVCGHVKVQVKLKMENR